VQVPDIERLEIDGKRRGWGHHWGEGNGEQMVFGDGIKKECQMEKIPYVSRGFGGQEKLSQ
jgi:hypothetical protein